MTSDHIVVDAPWLLAHSGDPDVVVVDATVQKERHRRPPYVSGRAVFERDGHIPGARHADLVGDFSDPDGSFLFSRPNRARVADQLELLGIGGSSRVVVYDTRGGAWAARLLWVLKSWGVHAVWALDGALEEWRRIGGRLETGPESSVAVPSDPVVLAGEETGFVDLAEVEQVVAVTRTTMLVSAVAADVYDGTRPVGGRFGHIPTSLGLSYRELLDDRSRVDLGLLQIRLEKLGISRGDAIVTYCGGGVDASGLAMSLHRLGFTDVAVYDGSLNEWNADPGRPLE